MSFDLAHQRVGSPSATRVVFLLHGALGSGQNLRALARRVTADRPELAVFLVDLRCHGGSHPAPAPHTLCTCVDDLLRLAARVGAPEAIVGHSFGGKVALHYAERTAALREVWALDSDPGTQTGDDTNPVRRVLAAARSVPLPIEARARVVETLLARGLSRGLGQWMTTNLRRDGEAFAWTLDFDGIEALLDDYFAVDCWPFLERVESGAAPAIVKHVVIAEQSDRWGTEARRRAERAADRGSIEVHHIDRAGHWLHVDNPDAVTALLVARLLA